MGSNLRATVPLLLLAIPASTAFAASKDFYCKKSPDTKPMYAPYSVRACEAGGGVPKDEDVGTCIYARVGCMIIDETTNRAAKLKYGKEFSALNANQKETVAQIVTPYSWLKTDTQSLAELGGQTPEHQDRALKNAEITRLTAMIEDVKDPKAKSELLTLKVAMFPSMLICRAPAGKSPSAASCPPPEKCKEDEFYNPREASIADVDGSGTPESPTLPAPLTPVSNHTKNGN